MCNSAYVFYPQRFKAKPFVRTSMIRNPLFINDTALVATQELVNHFSHVNKAFVLTICIQKRKLSINHDSLPSK